MTRKFLFYYKSLKFLRKFLVIKLDVSIDNDVTSLKQQKSGIHVNSTTIMLKFHRADNATGLSPSWGYTEAMKIRSSADVLRIK
ncbi:MAG: hypothetical protein WKF68_13330 [Daejeonella sp.]